MKKKQNTNIKKHEISGSRRRPPKKTPRMTSRRLPGTLREPPGRARRSPRGAKAAKSCIPKNLHSSYCGGGSEIPRLNPRLARAGKLMVYFAVAYFGRIAPAGRFPYSNRLIFKIPEKGQQRRTSRAPFVIFGPLFCRFWPRRGWSQTKGQGSNSHLAPRGYKKSPKQNQQQQHNIVSQNSKCPQYSR